DILRRILDVAGLAMDAVLRVDLQPRIRAVLVGQELIDASRAEALLWSGIFLVVHIDRDVLVLQRQMDRLILLMVGVGEEDRRRLVESIDAIILRILDLLAVLCFFKLQMIGMVMQRPWRPAAQDLEVEAGIEGAGEQTPAE